MADTSGDSAVGRLRVGCEQRPDRGDVHEWRSAADSESGGSDEGALFGDVVTAQSRVPGGGEYTGERTRLSGRDDADRGRGGAERRAAADAAWDAAQLRSADRRCAGTGNDRGDLRPESGLTDNATNDDSFAHCGEWNDSAGGRHTGAYVLRERRANQRADSVRIAAGPAISGDRFGSRRSDDAGFGSAFNGGTGPRCVR